MAIVKTNDQYYNDIAAAIRSKNGESALYYPSEMAQKIRSIPSGGGIDVDKVRFNGTIIEGRYLFSNQTNMRSANDGLWISSRKSSSLDDTLDHRNAYTDYSYMVPTTTTHVKIGIRFYDWNSNLDNNRYVVGSSKDGNWILPMISFDNRTRILSIHIRPLQGSDCTIYMDTLVDAEEWYEITAEWDQNNLTCILYDQYGSQLEQKTASAVGSINTVNRMFSYYVMGTQLSKTSLPKMALDLHNCFVVFDHTLIRGMNEMGK